MNVAVRARNVELPADVRAAAEKEVHRLASRVGGMEHADVRFLAPRAGRGPGRACGVCEMTMRGHGHVVRASGHGDDWSAAMGRTICKLERQVERLRSRLGLHAPVEHGISVHFPPHDTLAIGAERDEPSLSCGAGSGVRAMTPEQAALQMDLLGHDFYIFVNAENGSTGVVFRRTDGHVGLIDAG